MSANHNKHFKMIKLCDFVNFVSNKMKICGVFHFIWDDFWPSKNWASVYIISK